MAKVKIQGHASGTGVFTLTSPNSNTDRTITLPDADVTLGTDATKLPLAGGTLTGNVTGVKLGLGVAPTRFIDIKGAEAVGGGGSEIYQRWQVQSDNANVEIGFSDSPRQFNFGTATANALSLKTNNTERLHINSSGNVIVGTTSVADPVLLIQSSGSGDPQLNFSSAAANRSAKIRFLDNGSAVGGFINYLHNGDKMEFGSGSSTTVGFRVADGYSNAAQGLTFGSDTAAQNKLDDYEEGTWTPTVLGTTSISMRTIYNSHYTKVGNVVTLYTSFALNSSATPATGALRFGGFPFAFKTLGESSFPIQLYYSYKQTPMAYMASNGYCYYQNTNVGGNNSAGLNEGIFNNVNRNNMGMTFSYLTDA